MTVRVSSGRPVARRRAGPDGPASVAASRRVRSACVIDGIRQALQRLGAQPPDLGLL